MHYVIGILSFWAFITIAFLVWAITLTCLYDSERKKEREGCSCTQ